MDFTTLRDKFLSHADSLQNSKDPTAKYRAMSYKKVASVLTKCEGTATKAKINKLEITDYMKKKAISLTQTSETKTPKSNPDKLIKELTNFMGLGESRAKQLVADGLTHINQLHLKKWREKLPLETKTFLQLKPKVPIPREDIQVLEPYVLKINNNVQIVGSYRRGKSQSNDIDIMVVSDDENVIDVILNDLKTQLNGKVYPYSKGLNKMSAIVDMKELLDKKDAVYKLDIFRVVPSEAVPMLLYSTGSKEHNILMRRIAKKKGMLLNQKGLFKNGEKIPNLTTERDYFTALELDYKEPSER